MKTMFMLLVGACLVLGLLAKLQQSSSPALAEGKPSAAAQQWAAKAAANYTAIFRQEGDKHVNVTASDHTLYVDCTGARHPREFCYHLYQLMKDPTGDPQDAREPITILSNAAITQLDFVVARQQWGGQEIAYQLTLDEDGRVQ